jgi:undecaprenyl diphosphate synthase
MSDAPRSPQADPAEPIPEAAWTLARQGKLPRHLAMIMDGNGRWAQRRGLPRSEGHRAGAATVRAMTRMARRLGIETLTLYAFSEQNWSRPASEVQALLTLLVEYLASELPELHSSQIRLVAVGNVARMPLPVRLALQKVVDATRNYRGMTLALCLSYGGREDLVQAAQHLAAQVAAGKMRADAIDEAALSAALWTAPLRQAPDLVIRTSGEQRLSNFLLWDAAYAELIFSDRDWPDFAEADLTACLLDYAKRDRRFGGVAAPPAP